MKPLHKRLSVLENRRPGAPIPCAIHNRPGESFLQAAARLGITSGAYLSITEALTLPDWVQTAPAQQRALAAGTAP